MELATAPPSIVVEVSHMVALLSYRPIDVCELFLTVDGPRVGTAGFDFELEGSVEIFERLSFGLCDFSAISADAGGSGRLRFVDFFDTFGAT